MSYAILAVLVAVLGLLFLVYKRLEEVLKEVRLPTIKRAQDLPELKARLKNLQRPENRDSARSEARPEVRENRGDRPERGDRGNRGDRPERGDRGNRGDRNERGDRGNRENRGDRPERSDRPERTPAAEPVVAAAESAPAAAVAPVAESRPAGGRRPLTAVGTAPAPVAESHASSVDALAAVSLAQEAPEQPIRHGRRMLPKAKPNLDDVKLDGEDSAAN